MQIKNFFRQLAHRPDGELFEEHLAGDMFRLERIVSSGQSTPAGEWYDQPTAEWVVLLTGRAGLRFEDEAGEIELRPGDYVNIPAGCRHRVEWTDPDQPTIWLAVHYLPNQSDGG